MFSRRPTRFEGPGPGPGPSAFPSPPELGWMDYSHLNTTGAEIFSIWLGEEVGIAEVQGSLMMFRP
jgi:hypothetical protein